MPLPFPSLPQAVNGIFTFGMLMCVWAMFFVKEEYRKADAEDEMTETIYSRISERSSEHTPLLSNWSLGSGDNPVKGWEREQHCCSD